MATSPANTEASTSAARTDADPEARSGKAGDEAVSKPAVGSQVRHDARGEGTVVEHMEDGRVRVEFADGDSHRYHPASLYKLKKEDESRKDGRWDIEGWVQSLGLHRIVAAAIAEGVPASRHFDCAKGLKLSAVLASLRAAKLEQRLAEAIEEGALQLHEQEVATAEELSVKFQTDAMRGEMSFASLSTFFKGLEGMVGPPRIVDGSVLKAMEQEHCERPDSHEPFVRAAPPAAGDKVRYAVPADEWAYVMEPVEGKKYSSGRVGVPLAVFEERMDAFNVRLKRAGHRVLMLVEVAAVRLYSGPLFEKYNGVLRFQTGPALYSAEEVAECVRKTQERVPYLQRRCEQLLLGRWEQRPDGTLTWYWANKFETTLHSINSAVLKMSKLTVAGIVYRGIQGSALPKSFTEKNEHGVVGGVEFAFTSATPKRDVAVAYADGAASTLIEARMGMVNRGANIGWASQFPHEDEVLFPPLMAIEVVAMAVEKKSLMVKAEVSLNMASKTLEDVVARMRDSLLQTFDNFLLPFRAAGAPRRTLLESKRRMLAEAGFAQLVRHVTRIQAHVRGWMVMKRYSDQRKLDKKQAKADGRRGTAGRGSAGEPAAEGAPKARPRRQASSLVVTYEKAVQEKDEVSRALREAGVASDDEAARRRACAMLPALREGAVAPWPPVLVVLCTAGGEAMQRVLVALAAPLVRRAPLQKGAHVLAYGKVAEAARESWCAGSIARVRDDGTFDVETDRDGDESTGNVYEALPPQKVLIEGTGGTGALLREAAAAGMQPLVEGLLKAGVSPFEASPDATTALYLAAAAGHMEVCRLLLKAGADPHLENGRRQRPVNVATAAGNMQLAKLFYPSSVEKDLLEALSALEASPPSAPPSKPPAATDAAAPAVAAAVVDARVAELLRAADAADERAVRTMLVSRTGDGAADAAAPNGVTALMLASYRGGHGAVRCLLGAAAAVDALSERGTCALVMAAEEGHTPVVDALLRAGATVDLQTKEGSTALAMACLMGQEAVAQRLLTASADVNRGDRFGKTPLMHASNNGQEATARVLLSGGADVNHSSERHQTALHLACANGHGQVTRVLLDAGAALDTADGEGRTALIFASRGGHAATVRIMLQAGAAVNLSSTDGRTPVMYAGRNGHRKTVQVLLQGNAEVDKFEKKQNTVLMLACSDGHEGVVRALLQAGASALAANAQGETAVSLANKHGHTSCAKLCLLQLT